MSSAPGQSCSAPCSRGRARPSWTSLCLWLVLSLGEFGALCHCLGPTDCVQSPSLLHLSSNAAFARMCSYSHRQGAGLPAVGLRYSRWRVLDSPDPAQSVRPQLWRLANVREVLDAIARPVCAAVACAGFIQDVYRGSYPVQHLLTLRTTSIGVLGSMSHREKRLGQASLEGSG
jgi:hypothetical protein